MTDIITTHSIAIHEPSRVRLQFPNFGIGQSCEALCHAIMDAFAMAYVTPFNAMRRQPPIVVEEDLGGRDPSW